MKKISIKSLNNINDNFNNNTENVVVEQLESRFEIVYTHEIDENTNKIILVETIVEKTNVKCRITENDDESNINDTKSNSTEHDVAFNDDECFDTAFDMQSYLQSLVDYTSKKQMHDVCIRSYIHNVNEYEKQSTLEIGTYYV